MLIFTDNTTAEAWTKKMSNKSVQGRALARILCHLMMFSELGLDTSYIEGVKNTIADTISRYRKSHNLDSTHSFVPLLSQIPELQNCRRFQPSPELLSLIYDSLRSGCNKLPVTRVPLGQMTHDIITS